MYYGSISIHGKFWTIPKELQIHVCLIYTDKTDAPVKKKRRINLGIRGILEDRRNVYTSSTAVCRLLKIEIKDLNQADFENRRSIRNARKYKITSAHDTEFLGIALMTSAYFTFG